MAWKLLPLVLVAGLAACASSGDKTASPTGSPVPSAPSYSNSQLPSGKSCDGQPVQNLVGKTFSDSIAGDVKSGSSSDTVRVLKPGQVMTLEYNPSRVNIIVDGQGKISAIRCG